MYIDGRFRGEEAMRQTTILTILATLASAAIVRADVIYRLNVGGPDYTDAGGNLWRSDSALGYFNVGESFAVDSSVEIEGTLLDPIYRSHRYDSSTANPEMRYSFPVTPGYYSVRLHFAETYWGYEGRRRFGVELEGEPVLVDYDIVGLTGGKNVADVQQFVTQILDGDPTLTLEFLHGSVDHPLVCAIEIESIPPSPIILNGETASLSVNKNSSCGNAMNLLPLEAADPDSDGASLQWMIAESPTFGDVSFLGGIAMGADVIVCYQPAANQIVGDLFTIAVTDGDVGNVDEIVIAVQINDTQAPTIACPADATIDADASFTPDATGTATADDDFPGTPTITFSDTIVSGTCPIAIEIHRTWTARDAAGNTKTCVQNIDIRDDDTDGDGTVDCEDAAPNDAEVGGTNNNANSNDNANAGGGNENTNDNLNDNDNQSGSASGNSGVLVDPTTGQPIPTEACCGGGVPAMIPFLLLGWRRRFRLNRRHAADAD